METYAKVVADSISPVGVRLTTLELCFHRFILPEFNTHRMFSRNAASSRAIPVEKMIAAVEASPAMPVHWGKNQPGMQAREELDSLCGIGHWQGAVECAVDIARDMMDDGYHKQIVNRLLEPFAHIKVIVTATEWENFFELRLHPDAQPEIHELAKRMKEAMDNSVPVELELGDWHLPLSIGGNLEERIKTSVAASARVSFNNHDGTDRNINKDMKLHDSLLTNRHMSCFEHQATPMTNEEIEKCEKASEYIGGQAFFRSNFNRWTSYRWMIENRKEEFITVG